MILADLKLPPLEIPDEVRKTATGTDIDTNSWNVPLGADCWIACTHAWPHIDAMWAGKLFLTLSVVSSHAASDALCPVDLDTDDDGWRNVPAGRLFVIDPIVRHWLASANKDETHPWIGLQWEVPRAKARTKAREIVKQFQGVWLPPQDKRYARWPQ